MAAGDAYPATMVNPPKRKVQGGRVTPKGTRPSGEHFLPPEAKVSPLWVPIVLFTLLGLGTIMIIINYLGWIPGGTSNWWLLGGLGLILCGVITATQLH